MESPKSDKNLIKLEYLEMLDISNNKLMKFPKDVGNLIILTESNMSNNELTDYQKNISM